LSWYFIYVYGRILLPRPFVCTNFRKWFALLLVVPSYYHTKDLLMRLF